MTDLTKTYGNVCAVIGAQWGDEGKGKVVDLLSESYDIIARAAGGANAGHTIVVGGEKHVFHLLPSGCLHANKDIILGAGMVIHLPTLLEEIETLRGAGIDIVPNLKISHEAHILFEFHKDIDAALEEERSKKGEGIGTTKRGIGPAYMDKAERRGTRFEHLNEKIEHELSERASLLHNRYGFVIDIDREVVALDNARAELSNCVCDVSAFFQENLGKKSVLIEGAQGALLDIDHGTYPFVTSSSTTVTGALQALGLPPQCVNSAIGIAKAYCTRVGSGDFLTEAKGETEERLRDRGGEYGATTGRPRRCGWLHLPDLKKTAFANGLTHWNLTKLDVLDDEELIPVGIDQKDGKPVYEELQGWKASTAGVTDFDSLPENAKSYVEHIEQETGTPVSLIGTGPGREDMIVRS